MVAEAQDSLCFIDLTQDILFSSPCGMSYEIKDGWLVLAGEIFTKCFSSSPLPLPFFWTETSHWQLHHSSSYQFKIKDRRPLLRSIYVPCILFVHQIQGASSSRWIWESIFSTELKMLLFSIPFLKICCFQEVLFNNMWVLFALNIVIFTSVKFLILTESVNNRGEKYSSQRKHFY